MATDTTTLKRGTRIVAATPLPGVPEGTGGKVGRSVGMSLVRYRVAFDNGTEMNSVAHTKLVPETEWDEVLAEREHAAARADAPTEAAPPATDVGDGDGGGGGGGGTPADDRLARLLARSKAARETKQG